MNQYENIRQNYLDKTITKHNPYPNKRENEKENSEMPNFEDRIELNEISLKNLQSEKVNDKHKEINPLPISKSNKNNLETSITNNKIDLNLLVKQMKQLSEVFLFFLLNLKRNKYF